MLTVKNNMPQVLHTTGVRNGEVATLIIPPNHTTTCDATTPLLDGHAKSRMVTISGEPSLPPPSIPAVPTPPPSVPSGTSTEESSGSSAPTTSGGSSKPGGEKPRR